MSHRTRLGVMAGLLLGLASCAPTHRPGTPYTVTTRPNLAYGPLPAERGDLYLPDGAVSPPVVLVIHGGGWVSGSRGDDAALSQMIAARGMAVFTIDYRLANAASPDTRWPAQIVDAQLAVRWLRAHQATFGIDAAHMAAEGDSAGGHLALLLGVLPGIVPGDQAGLYPEQRVNVGPVADQFGPIDVATLPPWVHGIYTAWFGTPNPAPELIAGLSPLPYITGRTGPVLIIQGNADDIVPPAQSQQLAATLRSRGAQVEVVGYSGGHGFQGLDGSSIYGLELRVANWLAAQMVH